jgi:hypothetical protein
MIFCYKYNIIIQIMIFLQKNIGHEKLNIVMINQV